MISTQRMYVTAAKPRWKHTDTARSVITALCLLLIMSPVATAGAGTQSAADHWRACIFERDGTEVSVTLHWQPIDRNALFSKYWKNPYGKAGYGLRQSGAGYWIAIEELSPPAQAVIDAVKAQEDKVRSAPYAVVDLRGNSGGDDAYGRALADALYGSNYVTAMLGPNDNGAGDCTVFRASPDNIAAIAASAADFRTTGDVAGAEGYAAAVTRMKAAADTGHALSGSLTCPARPSSADTASLEKWVADSVVNVTGE